MQLTRTARFPDHARIAIALCLAALAPSVARAQTDYFNTDAGRPIRVEDAYALERRGFELQLAPLRIERARGGSYRWGIEPEVAFGILPRTQLEAGVPLVLTDPGGRTGAAGVELSLLHNFNVETAIPAIAIVADVLLPVGEFAPDIAYPSLKGIVTRSFRWARLHLNAQYTFGAEPPVSGSAVGAAELSRWFTGIAIDHAFPLESVLLTAELTTRQPIHDAEKLGWAAGAGARYQLTPRWALDGGLGRELSGEARTWHLTFGGAYAFGLPWRGRPSARR